MENLFRWFVLVVLFGAKIGRNWDKFLLNVCNSFA